VALDTKEGERERAGKHGFMAMLAPEQEEDLRARGVIRRIARGAALSYERQVPDRVLVLLRGHVKLSSLSEDSKEVVLGIRGPGDLIGAQSVIDSQPRSASALALEQIEALVLPADEFLAYLRRYPDVSLEVMKTISARLRDCDRKRVELAAQDSVARVAARVAELAERFGEPTDCGVRITLPISQEELAAWIGCSREAVSKALHSMRELGWLETQRRCITVHDRAALQRRSRESLSPPARPR
jgi:CRP/FNR family cyclic AMP-dependent transcriptional regulator